MATLKTEQNTCRDCGAQWSADDCDNETGFCFEQVTLGDESCR